MTYYIDIPGNPVPMGRPRVTTPGGHARAYLPLKTRQWLDKAAVHVLGAWRKPPWEGPVGVRVRCVSSRPQRLLRKKDPEGRMPRPVRGDIDNYAKSLLDCLQMGGVYGDDGQVVYLSCRDLWCSKLENPKVEVEIMGGPGWKFEL